MNITELLKGRKNCPCGRDHSCDIRHVVIKKNAADDLYALCAQYDHILVAADDNTYAAYGGRVVGALAEKAENVKVFSVKEHILVPNEQAIDALSALVTDKTDLILGVGSGVINDLCKYVSFKHGLRYYIVATAPSMDGYASDGAAMITNDMKTTFPARVPEAIIADTAVIASAPKDMRIAGFGDIMGKYSALSDWRLSALVNGEYFCDFVHDLTYDTMLATRALAKGVVEGSEEAAQTLMEALVTVGIAMAFAGSSRPASGSEHHLSHYFEITGLVKNRPYLPHGTDVFYSTAVTQRLREKLLALDGVPDTLYKFDRADWEAHIRESYGKAADGVIALQDKLGSYTRDLAPVYREKWEDIRKILASTPSYDEITALIESTGLGMDEFERFYGKDVIDDAILYAKDLKDRYTVLWVYFLLFNK